MPIPMPGIKDGINLVRTIYNALVKLEKKITAEENDKFVASLVTQIHQLYLSGKDARSVEIQLILTYLRNLGVDIASLGLPKAVTADLLAAATAPLVSISRSTNITAALAVKPTAAAKPAAKKAAAKPAAKKAAVKPAAKKAAAKPAVKTAAVSPVAKKAAAKPAAKKAAAKPAAKKAAVKPAAKTAAARPVAKKAAAKSAAKKVAAKPTVKKAAAKPAAKKAAIKG